MGLQNRFRNSAVARTMLCEFHGCFKRNQMTHADIDWFRPLLRCNYRTNNSLFQNQKGMVPNHVRSPDQPAFCHAKSRFPCRESKMAGETASIRVRDSLTVSEKNVGLHPELFDAGNGGRNLPEGQQRRNVRKLGFTRCLFLLQKLKRFKIQNCHGAYCQPANVCDVNTCDKLDFWG